MMLSFVEYACNNSTAFSDAFFVAYEFFIGDVFDNVFFVDVEFLYIVFNVDLNVFDIDDDVDFFGNSSIDVGVVDMFIHGIFDGDDSLGVLSVSSIPFTSRLLM